MRGDAPEWSLMPDYCEGNVFPTRNASVLCCVYRKLKKSTRERDCFTQNKTFVCNVSFNLKGVSKV